MAIDADQVRDIISELRVAGRACVGSHKLNLEKLRLLLGRAERALIAAYPDEIKKAPRGRFGGRTPPAASRPPHAEQIDLI